MLYYLKFLIISMLFTTGNTYAGTSPLGDEKLPTVRFVCTKSVGNQQVRLIQAQRLISCTMGLLLVCLVGCLMN